jgi:hypothetical protein
MSMHTDYWRVAGCCYLGCILNPCHPQQTMRTLAPTRGYQREQSLKSILCAPIARVCRAVEPRGLGVLGFGGKRVAARVGTEFCEHNGGERASEEGDRFSNSDCAWRIHGPPAHLNLCTILEGKKGIPDQAPRPTRGNRGIGGEPGGDVEWWDFFGKARPTRGTTRAVEAKSSLCIVCRPILRLGRELLMEHQLEDGFLAHGVREQEGVPHLARQRVRERERARERESARERGGRASVRQTDADGQTKEGGRRRVSEKRRESKQARDLARQRVSRFTVLPPFAPDLPADKDERVRERHVDTDTQRHTCPQEPSAQTHRDGDTPAIREHVQTVPLASSFAEVTFVSERGGEEREGG